MVRSVRLSDVKEIFEGAAELPVEARDTYLESACGSDDVRARVEEMLAAFDSGDDWLGVITRVVSDEPFESASEGPLPDRVGRYAIRRRISTGGMGTVYEGVQEQPHRLVAIKVLRHNLMHRSAMHRFRDEAQILGRLRHPAIAQIFDAAVYQDSGDELPYFVMEFVPGARSLTQHAKDRKLNVRDRLALFIRVCEGVHHGHQKGVVHRDLKPDNILVDSTGQPKIIDFGVARVTDADVALTTMHTEVGQLVGTLQYMSPEQLDGDPRDIDTRSDVFALGVVLFELLTGTTPHDIGGLAVSEALRMLRDTRPPNLSSIQPKLRGDLETIVAKAFERDRDRRYQSALELAQDLGRYLKGEAISARPPSLLYQLRVAARRNRTAAVAASTALVVIVAAAVVSTALYLQTRRERDDAIAARNRAQAAETFLGSMLTAVAPATPEEQIPFKAILDEATAMIDAGELEGQPLTEASLRQTLGHAYQRQQLWGEALPHREVVVRLYEATLGPEARPTLIAKMDLVRNLYPLDRLSEGRELAAETLATCRRVHPTDDGLNMAATLRYALTVQSVDGWRQAMEARIAFYGPDSQQADFGMHVYGKSLAMNGEAKRGRTYQERALDNSRRRGSVNREQLVFLSETYCLLGLFAEAEALLAPQRSEREEERRSGVRHGYRFFGTLARAVAAQGRLGEAEAILRAEIERARTHLGDHHWKTAVITLTLIDIMREMGRDEAMEIVLDEARFDGITPDTRVDLAWVRAATFLDGGELARAEVDARRALEILGDAAGPAYVARAQLVVAEVLFAQDAVAESLVQLELSSAFYDAKCEPQHPARARARRLLGALRWAEDATDAAEIALRDALDLDLEWRGQDDRETAKSRLALARLLIEADRIDEAREELTEARRVFASSAFEEGLWLPRVEAAFAALDSR